MSQLMHPLFKNWLQWQDQMNKTLNDFDEESALTSQWFPVDVREEEQQFTLEMELPGVKPEDVQIQYQNGILTVSGEKRTESKQKDKNYTCIERAYGKFSRSFNLPDVAVNSQEITAKMKAGVLIVNLPKSKGVTSKQIQVTSEE